MARVVIAGGGVTGLAASLFLARRGHEVVLLERDVDAPTGEPEADFEAWRRPGVPQARQPHVFHGLSRRILRAEAPELLSILIDAGTAIPVAPRTLDAPEPGDEDLVTTGLRRITFEAALRTLVARERSVTIVTGVAVEGLLTARSNGAVPHVIGVRTDRNAIDGDLVVDATGRRSALAAWLAEIDAHAPHDDAQDLRFAYHTRWYRVAAPAEPRWPPMQDLGFGSALAFPADRNMLALVFILAIADPLRRQVRDPAVFDRITQQIDIHRHYLGAGAEPVTDVQLMARLENRSRRLVIDDRPIVSGLVAIGDAALYTNPTLGRGVSLALAHSQHLADSVEHATKDPIQFASDFDAWTQQNLIPWFATQVAADGSRLAKIEAALHGTTPPTDPMDRVMNATQALAGTDPHVARALGRVMMLIAPPQSIGEDPDVQQRVREFLEANPDLEPPSPALTRERFAALVA
ncbi:MAG TPA: FAD-dependent oxidoreductase [Acidimicrobiia bacterium]|nr:FAD-dependent oxidoreductase [Acidimicrobiia bacterium]